MATENVIVTFSANADALKPTIDLLVKMGQISEKDAAEFKKLADESARLANEAKKAATEATGLSDSLPGGKKNPKPSEETKNVSNAIKSLRTQFAEAKLEVERLTQASHGKLTPELIKAAEAAARIDNKIKDLNKTLQALNPEAKLTAFVQLGVGVSGAFTAAQGAMALFGEQSEDVQKAILKVQAALALTQGLNSVLQLKDAFRNLRIVLGVTAVAGQGAAASIRAVSAAIINNPIAIAIAALGGLIAAIINIKSQFDDLQDKLIQENRAIIDHATELEKLKVVYDKTTGALTEYEAKLKELNIETNVKEQELYNKAVDNAVKSTSNFKSALATVAGSLGFTSFAAKLFQDNINDLNDAIDKNVAKLAESFNSLQDFADQQEDTLDIEELIRKNIENTDILSNAIKRQIEIREAQGNKELEIFDLQNKLIKVQLDGLKELEKIKKLNVQEEEKRKSLLTEIEKLEINRVSFIRKIEDQIFKERLQSNELLAKDNEDLIKRQLHNLELSLNKELDLHKGNSKQQELILEQYANKRKKLEFALSDEIEANNERQFARRQQLIEQIFREAEIELSRLGLGEFSFKIQLGELEVDKLEQLAINAELAGKDTSALRIQIEKLKKELSEFKDQDKFRLLRNIFGDLPTEQLEAIKSAINEIAEKTEEVFFQIIGNLSAAYKANAQELETLKQQQFDIYDQELERLEELNNNKIISDGKYAQKQKEIAKQREATEKEFNKRIAEEKRKAFIADRAASLIRVAINTAEAATKVGTSIPPPANIPFIAAVIALGAAQAALIASQPIPKFKRGVSLVQGPGTETSDSVPALLSKNERVISAETNKRYFGVLEAIHQNRISPQLINSFAVNHRFDPVEARLDTAKLTRSSRKLIPHQADAIGKAVAKHLKKDEYYNPLL